MQYKALVVGGMTIMLSLGAYSFAADYDCILTSSKPLHIYASKDYSDGPFATVDLDVASEHLNNYCNILQKIGNTAVGAESPYLFDQLIDIGFRKLDAYTDDSLRYRLAPDKAGTQWQTTISTFTSQFSNSDSKIAPVKENTIGSFIADFTKNRPVNTVGKNTSKDQACKIEGYSSLSLYEKYVATCEVARCISMQGIVQSQANSNTETSNTRLQSNPCNDIASNRFLQESVYVKQLITRVGIRAVTTTLSSYAENYFIGNRRQTLFDKMTLFDQYMTFVNHKVQEGTRSCSK